MTNTHFLSSWAFVSFAGFVYHFSGKLRGGKRPQVSFFVVLVET